MLEDQERQQAWAAQQSPQRPQRLSPRPYQQQPPGAAPPSGGGDTMGEFQQQFSKIAECKFTNSSKNSSPNDPSMFNSW
jgi:hypothetical protein